MISVGTNATLTIEDSNDKSTHYITLDSWQGKEVDEGTETELNNGSGTVKVSGGYITGGTANTHAVTGGGIKIGTDVSLTLQDGVVTGNKSSEFGGGIFVAGKLTLKGEKAEQEQNAAQQEARS